MLKVGVIGSRESVLAFRSLGVDVRLVTDEDEAFKELKAMTREESDIAIIYLQEDFYLGEAMRAYVDVLRRNVKRTVILIPGAKGSLGYGRSLFEKAVKSAIGVSRVVH